MNISCSFIRIAAVSLVFTSASCTGNDTPAVPMATSNRIVLPCDGKTLCFEKDGKAVSYNAWWTEKPGNSYNQGICKIYYEEFGGRFAIELNIYTNNINPGNYPITDELPIRARDATFLYFDGAFTLKASSGIVSVTDINREDKTISGYFFATAVRNDTVYKFTEGNFVNVPVK